MPMAAERRRSSANQQAALDSAPDAIQITVQSVGTYDGAREDPTVTLSDRQREAILAGLDLGYYDTPRRATHEDVAAELGCAPSTASEHLQKAAAKLVRETMERRKNGR